MVEFVHCLVECGDVVDLSHNVSSRHSGYKLGGAFNLHTQVLHLVCVQYSMRRSAINEWTLHWRATECAGRRECHKHLSKNNIPATEAESSIWNSL